MTVQIKKKYKRTNWAQFGENYIQARMQELVPTLKVYCEQAGISYTNACAQAAKGKWHDELARRLESINNQVVAVTEKAGEKAKVELEDTLAAKEVEVRKRFLEQSRALGKKAYEALMAMEFKTPYAATLVLQYAIKEEKASLGIPDVAQNPSFEGMTGEPSQELVNEETARAKAKLQAHLLLRASVDHTMRRVGRIIEGKPIASLPAK